MEFLKHILFLSLWPSITWAATLHQESFESATSPSTWTAIGLHDDGANDYSIWENDSSQSKVGEYTTYPTNPDGTRYFIFEDTDTLDGPPGGICKVELASVDSTGWSNITLKIAIADGNTGYDSTDYVKVYYALNGSSTTTLLAEVRGGAATAYMLDSVSSQQTTSDFSDFTYNIPGTPSSIIVRVDFFMSSDAEEATFDNLRLEGTAPPVVASSITFPARVGTSITFPARSGTSITFPARVEE